MREVAEGFNAKESAGCGISVDTELSVSHLALFGGCLVEGAGTFPPAIFVFETCFLGKVLTDFPLSTALSSPTGAFLPMADLEGTDGLTKGTDGLAEGTLDGWVRVGAGAWMVLAVLELGIGLVLGAMGLELACSTLGPGAVLGTTDLVGAPEPILDLAGGIEDLTGLGLLGSGLASEVEDLDAGGPLAPARKAGAMG